MKNNDFQYGRSVRIWTFNMGGAASRRRYTDTLRRTPLLRVSVRRHLPSIQILSVRYTLTDIGTFSKAASIPVPPFLLFRPVSVNINQMKSELSVRKKLQILTMNHVCRHSFLRLHFPHRCRTETRVLCAS